MTGYDLLRPILFSLGPELAHSLTLKGLSLGARFLPSSNHDDSRLAVEALGLNFSNPLGMAAGFDKNGEVPDALLKLGFGFIAAESLLLQGKFIAKNSNVSWTSLDAAMHCESGSPSMSRPPQ